MRRILLTLCIGLTLIFTEAQSQNKIISFNEMASFDAIGIEFKKVITDSRCPKSVSCVRAGEAIILISVYEDGYFIEDVEITINANSPIKSASNLIYETSKFTIYAYSLMPYPLTPNTIKIEDYRINVVFESK